MRSSAHMKYIYIVVYALHISYMYTHTQPQQIVVVVYDDLVFTSSVETGHGVFYCGEKILGVLGYDED